MVDFLPYEDALERILSQCPSPATVALPLERCLDRVLAAPVHADADVPPFNKSFMDGFAVRSADVGTVPARLAVVGEVAAGADSLPSVAPGEAVRIMTGAPVPPDTDAVQMVEESRIVDESTVEILKSVAPGANVSRQGREVAKGNVVLEAGRLIGPAEIGVLASFGQARPEVYRPLSAAVVSTGDELVPVEDRPRFGQIRNSNGPMISALCRRLGMKVASEVSVGDDPERIAEVIRSGLKFDLLLLSGGVSMGEYDFVHRVLEREGARLIFHKAAVKPGSRSAWVARGRHWLSAFRESGFGVRHFSAFCEAVGSPVDGMRICLASPDRGDADAGGFPQTGTHLLQAGPDGLERTTSRLPRRDGRVCRSDWIRQSGFSVDHSLPRLRYRRRRADLGSAP